jgi:flagellar biosynthesis/type III secretory pathway protein FliH
MNRVLRSVPISDETVTILVNHTVEEKEEEAFEDAATADASDGSDEDDELAVDGPSDQDASPAPEEASSEQRDDAEEEIGVADEIDGEQMIGLEEVAQRAAEEEAEPDEPPPTALDIEKQVEARLEEFETRFQQEKEDAYHSGFEDGTNEGSKQGLAQSAEEIERFSSLVESLPVQWKDAIKNYDAAVLDLAVKLAQRIVGAAAEVDESMILQAVHDCLSHVEDKTKVIIRVNPDDLEAVRRHRNDWLESLESIDHLLIESEPTVSKGGCIIETPIGDVDAQIEERLNRVRSALIEDLRKDPGEQE